MGTISFVPGKLHLPQERMSTAEGAGGPCHSPAPAVTTPHDTPPPAWPASTLGTPSRPPLIYSHPHTGESEWMLLFHESDPFSPFCMCGHFFNVLLALARCCAVSGFLPPLVHGAGPHFRDSTALTRGSGQPPRRAAHEGGRSPRPRTTSLYGPVGVGAIWPEALQEETHQSLFKKHFLSHYS